MRTEPSCSCPHARHFASMTNGLLSKKSPVMNSGGAFQRLSQRSQFIIHCLDYHMPETQAMQQWLLLHSSSRRLNMVVISHFNPGYTINTYQVYSNVNLKSPTPSLICLRQQLNFVCYGLYKTFTAPPIDWLEYRPWSTSPIATDGTWVKLENKWRTQMHLSHTKFML